MTEGSQAHKDDDREETEDLRAIVKLLRLDFHKLTSVIDFNTDNARKLALLVNTRQKIAMSIFMGVSVTRNPKLKLMTDSGRRRDLARMIQRAMIKNNPASKKIVEESAVQEAVESHDVETK